MKKQDSNSLDVFCSAIGGRAIVKQLTRLAQCMNGIIISPQHAGACFNPGSSQKSWQGYPKIIIFTR